MNQNSKVEGGGVGWGIEVELELDKAAVVTS